MDVYPIGSPAIPRALRSLRASPARRSEAASHSGPHAKLAAGSDENIARRLHDAAAEKCFIARSVSFKVKHEPTFEIAFGLGEALQPPLADAVSAEAENPG
jgi:hypothetical protein